MNLRLPARTSGLIVLVAVAILFFSCARDPHVRKQKYLPGGKAYFGPGKYREATMEYVKATQIDKSFADGRYQLALGFCSTGNLDPTVSETGTQCESPTNQSKDSGRSWKALAFSERLLLVLARVIMSS